MTKNTMQHILPTAAFIVIGLFDAALLLAVGNFIFGYVLRLFSFSIGEIIGLAFCAIAPLFLMFIVVLHSYHALKVAQGKQVSSKLFVGTSVVCLLAAMSGHAFAWFLLYFIVATSPAPTMPREVVVPYVVFVIANIVYVIAQIYIYRKNKAMKVVTPVDLAV